MQQTTLDKIPTDVLLKAAKERKRKLREEHGSNYAALMKLTPCPGCGAKCGVRELRRHKRECKKYQKLGVTPNRFAFKVTQ